MERSRYSLPGAQPEPGQRIERNAFFDSYVVLRVVPLDDAIYVEAGAFMAAQ